MKTPREILLQRHQTADARLDQVRREVVAQLQPPARFRREALPLHVVLKIWLELIWPARRIWAGLAMAWVFLLIANANLAGGQPVTVNAKNSAPADLQQKYQEEKQLLAELSGAREPRIVAPPMPLAPRPRSATRNKWETV